MRNLNKLYSESKRPRSWPLKAVALLAIFLVIAAGAQAVSAQASPDQAFRLFVPFLSNDGAQPATDQVILAAAASPTGATVTSDLPDYNPGATVTLTGAGWASGEVVHVFVNDDSGQTWSLNSSPDPIADANGAFTYSFQLPNWFVANYGITATGATSGTATTTFTDANPSANIDQCANDSAPSPSTDGCDSSANQWVNGNLGASKSIYFEGDSIPYRVTFDNLSTSGTHSITIKWDTTKSSTHALDYLTSFNQSVLDANPCLGVSGCTFPGSPSTFPIPADPQVTSAGVTPITGNFTLYGGTITSVSAYSYPDGAGFVGDKSATITINFSASVANPVLAWGGHISTRANWGANNSAVAISGSPYHTALVSLDGSGGAQDRSLSADAVIFPGSITIIKDATPNGSTSFGFTASPTPLTNFSLVDDGTSANTKVFSNITNFQSYTINETPIPAGWDFMSLACSVTTPNGGSYTTSSTTTSINMKEGESWTCTYTNTQRGTIIVEKQTNPDGAAGNFTFTGTAVGTIQDNGQIVVSNLVPGTYTSTENDPSPNFSLTSIVCDDGSSAAPSTVDLDTRKATFKLDAGETVKCVFTNTLQRGTLTVIKHVVNDNGGTKTASDFTLHVKGGGNDVSGSPAAGSESGTTHTLLPGTYVVSENTPPSGYNFTGFSGDCDSNGNVTLAAGQAKTCTLTNDDVAPKLHLRKVVKNDNGGTATVADFTLTANGTGTNDLSGTSPVDSEAGLQADTWALSETGPSGYSASAWSCVGGTQSGSNITVGIGGEATCTITNDDQPAKLKLVKTVVNDNGGTATTANFQGKIDNTNVDWGVEVNVTPGAHTASETTLAGYAASNWGGDCAADGLVSVALGESKTCTITNDDIAPKLHLRKVVKNDNGGTATVADFTLTADGTGSNDLSGTSPVDSGAGLQADTWTLSETGVAGYTASAWSCIGGTQSGSNITVGIGGEATCTITNDDQPAHLKLVKTVTNDNGGTAVATDFTLSAAGPTPLTGEGGAESDVDAGDYTLSETNLPGYTAGSWSCNGGMFTAPDKIAVALGESATCTINNNDQTAHLKLVKTVINDNGGTAQPTDFTLSAAGPTPLSGAGGAESDVNAGDYTLSETSLPGYTAGNWNCVGGIQSAKSQSQVLSGNISLYLPLITTASNVTSAHLISTAGASQNGNTITLAPGQSATCTIQNDDQSAHLKLIKTVTNDNGGTAVPTDFTLSAAGPTPLSGAGGTENNVNAGTYILSETSVPGYTAENWSCTGGTFTAPDKIAVALGESATCTINNNDQAAHLKLVKQVSNDNGGTAVATDFTLSADGPTPLSGKGGAEDDVSAGKYNLSETNQPGYTASAWSCTGGIQSGSSVTLALGESATCTITNDDIAPKLHLRKVVINDNGGTKTMTDFTLTANGTGTNDLSGASPVDSGASLMADTWALSEAGPTGYSASDWVCQGGTQNGSNITVDIGGEATCTITNDDIAPKLHLRKVVKNDNGGTKTAADFTLTANGTGTNDLTGASPVDSGAGLKADTWALSETNVYGYSASAWTCVGGSQSGSNITLDVGEEATCTITNDDQPGTIIIKKNTKPANTGSFGFTTTGSGYTGFTLPGGGQNSQTLSAGAYTVKESTQLGWILTGIGGSTDANTPYNCTVTGSGGSTGVGNLNTQTATINLKNGDTVICVFENTGQGVTRTQGFWATHPQLAQIAWDGGTAFGHTFPGVAATAGINDNTLCGRPIDTLGKLMGGFWSDISKTSTGAKRSALDQAKMQLLQQLLAAELNASAFGSVPSSGSFAAWETALCGTNQNAIKSAQQQAASFNSAGDSSSFTPGTSADSKTARSVANLNFWDVLP